MTFNPLNTRSRTPSHAISPFGWGIWNFVFIKRNRNFTFSMAEISAAASACRGWHVDVERGVLACMTGSTTLAEARHVDGVLLAEGAGISTDEGLIALLDLAGQLKARLRDGLLETQRKGADGQWDPYVHPEDAEELREAIKQSEALFKRMTRSVFLWNWVPRAVLAAALVGVGVVIYRAVS
jgi:hypothetical protein